MADEEHEHPFLRLFKIPQMTEEQRFDHGKNFLQPSWRDVTQKVKAVEHFQQWAIKLASHAIVCDDPTCRVCAEIPAKFCTPQLFVKIMSATLGGSSVDEAKQLGEFWNTVPREVVEHDPRYLIFKSNWDEQLVQAAVSRRSLQDVFRNEGFEIE